MENFYNIRSPAVKRLMREAEELRNATEEYYAQPLEGNLFEWHFTVRGPPKTDFDGGVYHGRIILPPDYPMKPPNIILFTPNGRFEVNRKICLSISGHHPESWQPSWSIRTALLAIIGFMPTHGNGAIGSLDYTPEERQTLAERSRTWKCTNCGIIEDLLLETVGSSDENSDSSNQEESDDDSNSTPQFLNSDETCFHSDAIIPPTSENYEPLITETFPIEGTNRQSQAYITQSPHHGSFSSASGNEPQPTGISHYFTPGTSTICIWTIIFLIASLLIRRIFFM